jgi:hypothetical protein
MPIHGFSGNVRYGIQSVPGTKVPILDRVDMPDFIRRVRQNAERNYHEVTGIGSGYLQDQQLLMRAPVIEIEHDVCGPDFILNCVRAAGLLPLLTLEISRAQSGAAQASAWVDCLCASMRLAAAQREPLRATTTWWPLTEEVEAGEEWAAPLAPPFAFIHGTWSLGGEIIGIEIDVDHGLSRDQYISTVAPGDPYAPSYVLVGRQAVTARIRSTTIYDITEVDDVIDANLVFTNGAEVLTIALTAGAYRGQEHEMSGDAVQEFGIPLTFQDIAIS